MIFGINTTCDISKCLKFTRLTAREIKYNNFEISLVVFLPNVTTNHAITYTNKVMSLLKIILIYGYEENLQLNLLSGQPPLSGHLLVP